MSKNIRLEFFWKKWLIGSTACWLATVLCPAEIFLGQGVMSGEVTASTALVQTRLTAVNELNNEGDLPGAQGVVFFQWSTKQDLSDHQQTPFKRTTGENDFIVRAELNDLVPNTRYFYRAVYGPSKKQVKKGPICSFKTLPGQTNETEVRFLVGSCMNYIKFMHGRKGNAGGPVTATEEDKRLGFPAFVAMKALQPDFFIGTGDIVYYDNPFRVAVSVPQLRQCWHEQFRFPRMIDFFQHVPSYWSKDDHDFRYNDSDNTSEREPSSATGIRLFREQLPIAPAGDVSSPNYRTHRVSKGLQFWLTEGRDHRSPNAMKDGPSKTLWGREQLAWLKKSLKECDAKWKIVVTPTPLVGPDDAYKNDNHVVPGGFQHEAREFYQWLSENKIENFITICGDRHWQFHSIHPSGYEEFACGALNDENARIGAKPGEPKGSDHEALIKQPFTSPKPRGGFLHVTAGKELHLEFYSATGELLYQVTRN